MATFTIHVSFPLILALLMFLFIHKKGRAAA
jgi:hypothetical protein